MPCLLLVLQMEMGAESPEVTQVESGQGGSRSGPEGPRRDGRCPAPPLSHRDIRVTFSQALKVSY